MMYVAYCYSNNKVLSFFLSWRHQTDFLHTVKSLSCSCVDQTCGLLWWLYQLFGLYTMLHFSNSVLMKKLTHLNFGWPVGYFKQFFFVQYFMSSYLCTFYVFLSVVKLEVIICSAGNRKRERESCSGMQCLWVLPQTHQTDVDERWYKDESWCDIHSGAGWWRLVLPDPLPPGILPQTWREDFLCHVVSVVLNPLEEEEEELFYLSHTQLYRV